MIQQRPQKINKQSSFYIEPDFQADEQDRLEQETEVTEYKQNYGNLIIFSKSILHLSVGPDYSYSIAAFLMLFFVAFGVIRMESLIGFQIVGKTINYVIGCLPSISFLITLLSNPGIYDAQNNDEPKRTYCNICKVFQPKKVHHCERCNVCIEEYDHHCPWLSKCVGKSNLAWFYVFIASIPLQFCYFLFLIYSLISKKG